MARIIKIIFTLIAFGSINTCYAEQIKIENGSFGVVTEIREHVVVKQKKKDDIHEETYKFEKIAVYIENKECIGNYKVVVGDVVLGEGKTDFKGFQHQINLGNTNLKVDCQADSSLQVTTY